MSYKIVDYVTATASSYSHEYVFQIALSTLGLDDLKHHKWLGFRFPKNRITFIKDLSEVLAIEICEELLKIQQKERAE